MQANYAVTSSPTYDAQQYNMNVCANVNNMYQIPQPTAVVDSMYPQQRHPSLAFTGAIRRRSPESLIPIDAPTQPRRYITPSVTSRKEIPSFFSNKRPMIPSDEEEDELTEEPPAANATDQEKIEWKRRQNTLAARRSRKRKLMYQQQLEMDVEQLKRERDMWRTRAVTLKQLLLSHGIRFPDFQD